jgi:hypothetical protein
MIWVVIENVRIVLYQKAQDFVRVGEMVIELAILTYILLIYRTTSSVNGITLQILSLSILVPH